MSEETKSKHLNPEKAKALEELMAKNKELMAELDKPEPDFEKIGELKKVMKRLDAKLEENSRGKKAEDLTPEEALTSPVGENEVLVIARTSKGTVIWRNSIPATLKGKRTSINLESVWPHEETA